MISQSNAARRRRGARLGTTSALVAGGLTYGASPAYAPARAPIIRPGWGDGIPSGVVMTYPGQPIMPTWGENPPRWGGVWGGYGGPQPSNPNLPTSANNLAQLTLQYQSNPNSLTPTQWQQLQAAGVIPGTVPYSNAALVTPPSSSGSGIDPTTGQSYAAELAAAQAAATIQPAAAATSSIVGVDPATGATTIFGLDWYYVAGFALIAAYALSGKRGR